MKRWEEMGDYRDRCLDVARACLALAAAIAFGAALLAMGGVL
jgi:hypothetical protein